MDELISITPTIFLNLVTNWKNNKEKNIIIDPISCLIKLSILGFYPDGTKISINNNMVNILEPSYFQGIYRFIRGDGREDLHNLYLPIIKSIEWYWDENNPEIKHLFDYSIKGIEKLKHSYPPNSIISHTLDLYIHHLTTKQTKTLQNREVTFNNDHNKIHEFIKELWSPREIHIIIELILDYSKKILLDTNETQILNSILELTTAKEKKLKLFLKEHFASL